MRTVKGPTDNVVVVGAGLAGLSAAMRLAGAGRTVTVLERESIPGGRAGRLDIEVADGTYRFDTGPTVLTMPDLIADAFDCLGEEMSDWLTLEPVEPLYRLRNQSLIAHQGQKLLRMLRRAQRPEPLALPPRHNHCITSGHFKPP